MWQEIKSAVSTILESDFQSILGLCLLLIIAYILYSERNNGKDGDNLALVIKALSDPLGRLMLVQERLVDTIEAQGTTTRALINAQTGTLMDSIAITHNKLSTSDNRLKGVEAGINETVTWVTKQPQAQAQIMASIADLDNSISEKANEIMRPIETIAEIKQLLQDIKADIATLQTSITKQQSAIDGVNLRVGMVEQRTTEVIRKIEQSEVKRDVIKDTKQLATNSNNPVNNSADSIGNQSSAGASPVGGVS